MEPMLSVHQFNARVVVLRDLESVAVLTLTPTLPPVSWLPTSNERATTGGTKRRP